MLCMRGTGHGPVSVSVCLTQVGVLLKRLNGGSHKENPGALIFRSQRSPRNSTRVSPYWDAKCRWGGLKSETFDDGWVFPKWAWSWSREQFLHCGLREFRHSKSSVYRWYPQLDRGRFVYDTYRTMEATRSRHGWVHMFITHSPTVNLQLHNTSAFW